MEHIVEALRLLSENQKEVKAAAMNNVPTLIGSFNYEPENGTTFDKWYARNQKCFESYGTVPAHSGRKC